MGVRKAVHGFGLIAAGGESPLGADLVAMARRVEWQLLTQVEAASQPQNFSLIKHRLFIIGQRAI